MLSRSRAALMVVAMAMVPSLLPAEQPRSRAGLWELGVTTGLTVLDGGYDAEIFGYTVRSGGVVPPTTPDNLDSTLATAGIRVGYSFTRFFALEVAGSSGTTQIGNETSFVLQEDFSVPGGSAIRKKLLREQELTAPGIRARLSGREFDFNEGQASGVFTFNNRPDSKWTFYFALGGGAYSLDTDTARFNDCAASGAERVITDPGISPFNSGGDPNDPNNVFVDNPQQVSSVDLGCERAFPVAEIVSIVPEAFTFGRARFRNSSPLLIDPAGPKTVANQQTDPSTGAPLWIVPPGILTDPGVRSINPINSLNSGYYTAGVGVRWFFKPRHVVRADARRMFDETRNKNFMQFTLGYSFMMGKGRKTVETGALPPVEDLPASDELSSPDDALPEPDEDAADPEAGRLTLAHAR